MRSPHSTDTGMTDTHKPQAIAYAERDLAQRKREMFIAELRECGSVKYAASVAGLLTTNLYQERKTNTELAEAWQAAMDEFAGKMHRELIDAARGHGHYDKPSAQALIKLNEAHNPELFREPRQTIVNVQVGDFETMMPAPARAPSIETPGHVVEPPKALPE